MGLAILKCILYDMERLKTCNEINECSLLYMKNDDLEWYGISMTANMYSNANIVILIYPLAYLIYFC